jgi:hypothetical protein
MELYLQAQDSLLWLCTGDASTFFVAADASRLEAGSPFSALSSSSASAEDIEENLVIGCCRTSEEREDGNQKLPSAAITLSVQPTAIMHVDSSPSPRAASRERTDVLSMPAKSTIENSATQFACDVCSNVFTASSQGLDPESTPMDAGEIRDHVWDMLLRPEWLQVAGMSHPLPPPTLLRICRLSVVYTARMV